LGDLKAPSSHFAFQLSFFRFGSADRCTIRQISSETPAVKSAWTQPDHDCNVPIAQTISISVAMTIPQSIN
jgi:hypothetical protein